MSPENQARAKLLWLQSEGVDITNQEEINKAQAMIDQGSVADTLAKAGQPGVNLNAPATLPSNPYRNAGGRTANYTRAMTPMGAVIASRGFQGGDVNDLRSAINLGQQANPAIGPGNTFDVQSAVGQANKMPYDLTAGTERHFPTVPGGGTVDSGAAGGGAVSSGTGGPGGAVVSGPDITSQTATTKTAEATSAIADKAREIGNAAVGAQAQLQTLTALYDKLAAVNPNDPGGWTAVLQDEGTKALAAKLGLDVTRLSDRVSAQKYIQNQMMGLLGQVRGAQGEPPLRGGIEAMIGTLPNPLDDPNLFHAATSSLNAVLNHHIADGAAASAYKTSAMDKAAQNQFFGAQDQNAQAEAREIMKHPEMIGKGDDTPPAPGAKKAPDGKWYVPDPNRPGKYLQVVP